MASTQVVEFRGLFSAGCDVQPACPAALVACHYVSCRLRSGVSGACSVAYLCIHLYIDTHASTPNHTYSQLHKRVHMQTCTLYTQHTCKQRHGSFISC